MGTGDEAVELSLGLSVGPISRRQYQAFRRRTARRKHVPLRCAAYPLPPPCVPYGVSYGVPCVLPADASRFLQASPNEGVEPRGSNRGVVNPCKEERGGKIQWVKAKGDGPEAKTMIGFLYRYAKEEDVSIMCACHRQSFSPAEFLRHAGRSDTSRPLQQIVVVPSPPVSG